MAALTGKRPRHGYAFDAFILDEQARTLERAGETVALAPKAFEMLLVLVRHAGESLGKEELLQQVWPDAFVEEANLAVHISMLRKALGERPGGGQYIETLPRRGYRFAADVREFHEEIALSSSADELSAAITDAPGVMAESDGLPARRTFVNYFTERKSAVIAAIALSVIA